MPPQELDRLEVAQRLLGQRLRTTRQRSGLTLPQASVACGLSTGHLSDIERGRGLPSLQALLAMADAYGVLVTTLLSGFPFGTSTAPSSMPSRLPDGRSAR